MTLLVDCCGDVSSDMLIVCCRREQDMEAVATAAALRRQKSDLLQLQAAAVAESRARVVSQQLAEQRCSMQG